MYKVFKEDCVEGVDGQENGVVIEFVDSFNREWRASNLLDDYYTKAQKQQNYRYITRKDNQLYYYTDVYNAELDKSVSHFIRYYIEECRTVRNGDEQIDVSNQAFDFIDDFHYGRAVVKRDEKYGIVDEKFKIILPTSFFYVAPYEPRLALESNPFARVDYDDGQDYTSRYVDLEGNFLVRAKGFLHRIPPEYYYPFDSETRWVKVQLYSKDSLSDFEISDSPCANYTFYDVERKEYFRFGDHPGPDSFEEDSCAALEGFEGDVARFKMNGKCGLINSDEKILVEPKYEQLLAFSDGLSAFKTSGVFEFARLRNGDAKQVYPDGGGKWGFIDKSGREVIPARYDMVHPFSAGHAAFNLGGSTIVEFPDVPDEVYVDYPPCKYLAGGKWGFIDLLGNEVRDAEYDWASPFAKGMVAILCKGSNYGLISADLKYETELIYRRIRLDSTSSDPFSPVFDAYLCIGYDEDWDQNVYREFEITLQKDGFVVKETGCVLSEEDISSFLYPLP